MFSGAAGLKIGYALINPGNKTRANALVSAAKEAALIMIGATIMLIVAAFIEAFWSPNDFIGNSVKYIVGACLWFVVIAYPILFGRRHESR